MNIFSKCLFTDEKLPLVCLLSRVKVSINFEHTTFFLEQQNKTTLICTMNVCGVKEMAECQICVALKTDYATPNQSNNE